MIIHTLGTGHGDSTFSRFNSSTLYETDDGMLYMIDAGAPADALMRRQGCCIHNLRAVFLTHMHNDHVGGLPEIIKQVDKYPSERQIPLSVYLPEKGAIPALQGWLYAIHMGKEQRGGVEYLAAEPGELFEDENLQVTAIRTRHLLDVETDSIPCSLAYVLRFKKENRTVLHTGDLWTDFTDFPQIAAEQHFDACLCEATHYDPGVAAETLREAKLGRLILTHIANRWHTYIRGGWEMDDGERKLLSFFRDLPYPVDIAHDGDRFRI